MEALLSSENVLGRPLVNHANLEVCTSSFPHPDGAELVRQPSPGVYCYTGRAAGLNDINGNERDQYGVYIRGPEYCHVVWVDGLESMGAKRPATRSYPAPGSVTVSSPIVWRPVNPNVAIANR